MGCVLWPSVGEEQVEKVEEIETYYPFGPILKNSSTFFRFLLSHRLIFNAISRSIKAYPRSYELTKVCRIRTPISPHRQVNPMQATYVPSALRNVSVNIMILPFHTRLSNTDTPHMPRAHDSHRKTKHDTQDINQYERELGHQIWPFGGVRYP